MFTSLTTRSSPLFLRQTDTGVIMPCPAIAYCHIVFDVGSYRDSLFSEYAIPFPFALDNAVAKRRAEYLAVRFAARQLLQNAGCDGHVGTGHNRAPVWPADWCGSLSHTDGHAIAIIAPRSAGITPGIDIEMLDPSAMRETADMFTIAEEQQLLAASGIAYETALLLAFSAKESVFKALYPEVGDLFGFEVARVCAIDAATNSITLELTQDLTPTRRQGSFLRGYFLIEEDRVITLIA